jgi:hypothetical protein
MVAVRGIDVYGASIPIEGMCLHGGAGQEAAGSASSCQPVAWRPNHRQAAGELRIVMSAVCLNRRRQDTCAPE